MVRLGRAVAAALLACAFCDAKAAAAPLVAQAAPGAIQTPAWRVAWADLNGDKRVEVLYLSLYGNLTCQDLQTGKVLWSRDLDGKAWKVTTADLDGDGKPEVLAITGKSFSCLDGNGAIRWRKEFAFPMYAIAAGHLLNKKQVHVAVGGEDEMVTIFDGRGTKVKSLDYPYGYHPHAKGGDGIRTSVHTLDAGDTDGDGIDELLVVSTHYSFALARPASDGSPWVWDRRKPDLAWLYDGRLIDLDGDGRCEAYVGGRSWVLAVGPDGKDLWRKTAAEQDGDYAVSRLAKVDGDRDGRPELAVLCGPMLSLFEADGSRPYSNSTAEYWFNDIAGEVHQLPGTVLLGSVTGCDRNVYAVSFRTTGIDGMAAFREPPGHRKKIIDNLLAIHRQVDAAKPDKGTPRRTFHFPNAAGSYPLQRMRNAFKAWDYPYDNIVFHAILVYQEEGAGETGQGRSLPTEELMQIAEAAEANGTRHILGIGHGAYPGMTLSTVQQWLQRTPKTFLGLMASECQVNFYTLPENAEYRERLDRYLEEFLGPCIDAAAGHGKPTFLMMKQNFWTSTPAMRYMRERLYTEGRRKWIVPQCEDSMTIAAEQSIMGQVGMWRSGMVQGWALNIINDQMNLDKMELPLCSDPSSTIRQMVAYAGLGATHFKLKLPFLFDVRRKYGSETRGGVRWTPTGLLTCDLMIHMLGKGLIDVPAPETIVGLVPVAFRMAEPSEVYARASCAHDVPYETQPASRTGLLGGFEWPHMPTPDTYAPRYLLNARRYGYHYIPQTPYGLPVVVPLWFQGDMAWAQKEWVTDGISCLERNATRSAADARGAILESFRKAAEALPVRASHCFWIGTRRADGTIRVTLVGNDYLDPVDQDVELTTLAPIASLRDVIADQRLPFMGKAAKLRIPAGAFRIVDVKTQGGR